MAWTGTPKTWTADVVTVPEMNTEIRDRLIILKTSIADDGKLASTGGTLVTPLITMPRETQSVDTIVSGALTINLALGSYHSLVLNQNITTITITNVPTSGGMSFLLALVGDGSQRTITWPALFLAPSAVFPTPSPGLNKIDIFGFITFNAGANWMLSVIGQNI